MPEAPRVMRDRMGEAQPGRRSHGLTARTGIGVGLRSPPRMGSMGIEGSSNRLSSNLVNDQIMDVVEPRCAHTQVCHAISVDAVCTVHEGKIVGVGGTHVLVEFAGTEETGVGAQEKTS